MLLFFSYGKASKLKSNRQKQSYLGHPATDKLDPRNMTHKREHIHLHSVREKDTIIKITIDSPYHKKFKFSPRENHMLQT